MTKKIILIVAGDPNSINTEIIYKSWKKIKNSLKEKIIIIGNHNLIVKQFKKLKYSIKTIKLKNLNEYKKTHYLKILNVDLKFSNPFKVKKINASKYVIKSLEMAHKISIKKDAIGFINCAIDKKLLLKKNTGVTEFLALKCGIKNNSEVMLIRNKNLSVVPITTHIDLKNVAKKIKAQNIIKKVKTLNSWFLKYFGRKPKIAILGLNPHNSEFRSSSEEKTQILPSIKRLKSFKIKIEGPFAADTIFMRNFKNYDVVVGMYHDQVLAPFKSIFKLNAINITLGLKYLRVSPDHGTAINLVLKNEADETSLKECINFINKSF